MEYLDLFGHIKKQETLITLENKNIARCGVLESLHPFPGYHGRNLPDEEKPRALFLLLSSSHSTEEVARHTKAIKNDLHLDFHAADGTIFIHPYQYPCLRIKHLSTFQNLSKIIKEYENKGLEFNKSKEIKQEEAIIKIYKNFLVREEEKNIYHDLEDKSKGYLEIPEKLDWESFREITFNIKNNLIHNNFDAALGVFFRAKGISDIIRIYDQDKETERLRSLRDMYLKEIEQLKK
jgi:hypothetical protein